MPELCCTHAVVIYDPFVLHTLQVHQAVIDAGDKVSGCTIHEVTEEVDGGPILVQKVVKVGAKSIDSNINL